MDQFDYWFSFCWTKSWNHKSGFDSTHKVRKVWNSSQTFWFKSFRIHFSLIYCQMNQEIRTRESLNQLKPLDSNYKPQAKLWKNKFDSPIIEVGFFDSDSEFSQFMTAAFLVLSSLGLLLRVDDLLRGQRVLLHRLRLAQLALKKKGITFHTKHYFFV